MATGRAHGWGRQRHRRLIVECLEDRWLLSGIGLLTVPQSAPSSPLMQLVQVLPLAGVSPDPSAGTSGKGAAALDQTGGDTRSATPSTPTDTAGPLAATPRTESIYPEKPQGMIGEKAKDSTDSTPAGDGANQDQAKFNLLGAVSSEDVNNSTTSTSSGSRAPTQPPTDSGNDAGDDGSDILPDPEGAQNDNSDDGPDTPTAMVSLLSRETDEASSATNRMQGGTGDPIAVNRSILEFSSSVESNQVVAKYGDAKGLQPPLPAFLGQSGDLDPLLALMSRELPCVPGKDLGRMTQRSEEEQGLVKDPLENSPPVSPALAGLLGDILPVDIGAMEQGLQEFLDSLNTVGDNALPHGASLGWISWFTTAAITTAGALELTRRHLRQPSLDLVMRCTDEDSTWSWLTIAWEPRRQH